MPRTSESTVEKSKQSSDQRLKLIKKRHRELILGVRKRMDQVFDEPFDYDFTDYYDEECSEKDLIDSRDLGLP